LEEVKVKLPKFMEKNNRCFVDPENGVMISPKKYDGGCMVVPRTKFVRARIQDGTLIEVSDKATMAEDAKSDVKESSKKGKK